MTINRWQSFLNQAGATFTESGSYFSQDLENAAVQSNCLADLSHLGLIAIKGPDAEKFLQGQLTCDVREVSQGQARLGAHCNPKGRMLSNFRLFFFEDSYYLQLPSSMLQLALSHLAKYALFSKVSLTDATADWIKIGFAGPSINDSLAQVFSKLPDNVDSTVVDKEVLLMRLPGIAPRYETLGSYEASKNIWQLLAKEFQPIGYNDWNLLDIMAGIPSVYPQTAELFTPHQLNYQLINGINFKKGCYTGQEVVARMQYLGKLKQHMYRAIVQAEVAPLPREAIFMDTEGEPQPIGEVVMSAQAPAGYQMLIAMQDKGLEHRLRLNGKLITLLDLPYLSFI
jgi:folate-binding protein YgfZ